MNALHQGSEGSVLVGGIGRDFSLKVMVQSFPASSTHCSNWASSALGSNHGNEIVMTNWDHGRLSLHSFPYYFYLWIIFWTHSNIKHWKGKDEDSDGHSFSVRYQDAGERVRVGFKSYLATSHKALHWTAHLPEECFLSGWWELK